MGDSYHLPKIDDNYKNKYSDNSIILTYSYCFSPQHLFFFFMVCAFGVKYKKILPNSKPQVFSPRIVIVLGFAIMSMIHFKLFLCMV